MNILQQPFYEIFQAVADMLELRNDWTERLDFRTSFKV